MPYRDARTLPELIAPDRRRRDAFLLVLGGMIAGAACALFAPDVIAVAEAAGEPAPVPRAGFTSVETLATPVEPRRIGIGFVQVTCVPRCTTASVNGEEPRYVPPQPTFLVSAPPGRNILTVTGPNDTHRSMTVYVGDLEERSMEIDMRR